MSNKKKTFTNYLTEQELLDLLFDKIIDVNTSDFCSVASIILEMNITYVQEKDIYKIQTKFEVDVN